MRPKTKVDIGVRFGRLTVVSFSHRGEHRRLYWKCRCDCGGEKTAQTGSLTSGNTRSCGCLRVEASVKRRVSEHHSAVTAVILGYQRHAIRRGYVWQLSRDQVESLIQGNCAYCGSPPNNVKQTKNSRVPLTYSGIDRVNNNLGYVTGNVVSCCANCNRAKGTKSADEFLTWIRTVHKHTNSKEALCTA